VKIYKQTAGKVFACESDSDSKKTLPLIFFTL